MNITSPSANTWRFMQHGKMNNMNMSECEHIIPACLICLFLFMFVQAKYFDQAKRQAKKMLH